MADPDPKDIRYILVELRDVNKEKRRTAVMKLGMVGGDEAVRALIRTVENEREDLIVRGRAAMMLGKLGDTRAVMPLIRALNAPGFQTRYYAAQALGELGDHRAVDPLIALAENQKDRVREAALDALQRLGYPRVAEENCLEPMAQPE